MVAETDAPKPGALRVGVLVAVLHPLSRRTIQRRLDAWLDGDRSPYAIRCARTGGDRGVRLADPVDVERVRLQLAGELDQSVTAEQYATSRRARRGPG